MANDPAHVMAIMQPYFFPYLGYFQLINQVENFIFHDNVQYIKAGWINRNRILRARKGVWLSFPVLAAPHTRSIDQRFYQPTISNKLRLLHAIKQSYCKSPYFSEIFPLLQQIMSFNDANVANFNINLICRLAQHLKISSKFIRASDMVPNNSLKGQARVIDLCQRSGAKRYINPIGGTKLYQSSAFAEAGIDLGFLKPTIAEYQQFDPVFVPDLSIIDVMMFNHPEQIAVMLNQCQLMLPMTSGHEPGSG